MVELKNNWDVDDCGRREGYEKVRRGGPLR